MPKTTRKDGTPTAYGFTCGYGMVAETPYGAPVAESRRVTLFLVHGVFELKAVDWSKALDVPYGAGWNDPADFRRWSTPDNTKEARRMFAAECKRLGLAPKHRK